MKNILVLLGLLLLLGSGVEAQITHTNTISIWGTDCEVSYTITETHEREWWFDKVLTDTKTQVIKKEEKLELRLHLNQQLTRVSIKPLDPTKWYSVCVEPEPKYMRDCLYIIQGDTTLIPSYN